MLGFAAQQQTLQAFATVRGHDDQIAFTLFGGLHNRLGDQVRMNNLCGDSDFAVLAKVLDAVEQRIGLFSPLALNALGFLDVQQVAAFHIAARVVRNHLECDDRRAAQCGQVEPGVHGLVGEFRAIGGYQNAVVHRVLLSGF